MNTSRRKDFKKEKKKEKHLWSSTRREEKNEEKEICEIPTQFRQPYFFLVVEQHSSFLPHIFLVIDYQSSFSKSGDENNKLQTIDDFLHT